MLFKTILASLVLVGAAIAAPPPTEPEAPSQVPQQGQWADGTVLYWLCEPGMKGRIRILVVAPDGTKYPAEVECISPTAKQI